MDGPTTSEYLSRMGKLALHLQEQGDVEVREVILGSVAAHLAGDRLPEISKLGLTLAELPRAPLDEARPPGGASAEILGLVHESLIGTLARRKAGAVFTPPSVAAGICQMAMREIRSDGHPLEICDPAVGGAAFLLAVARILRKDGTSYADIVPHLYGADQDPLAAAVADMSLVLLSAEDDADLGRANIRTGNSLVGARLSDLRNWEETFSESLFSLLPSREREGSSDVARQLDGLTAYSIWESDSGRPALEQVMSGVDRGGEDAISRSVDDLRRRHGFIHWDLLVEKGFDLVVGNPPFLSQLSSDTARQADLGRYLGERFPDISRGYADTSSLFLHLAMDITRPGGCVAMILPESFLATRDSAATRQSVLDRGELRWLWRSVDRVFDASVQVVALVVRISRESQETVVIGRAAGSAFDDLPGVEMSAAKLRSLETWSPLVAEASGVPRLEINMSQTLGDFCTATADFRDHFYGLVPFVVEGDDASDDSLFPPLATVGLLDPARCMWGLRPTRFAKTAYLRPRVDLEQLRAKRSDLATWADSRLVPKVLLPTQTRVLEPFADGEGRFLPSIPIISLLPESDRIWHVASALASPVLSAWAVTHFAGAALSSDAIKVSARQVLKFPCPSLEVAWDEAATAFAEATDAPTEESWRSALELSAAASCRAYDLDDSTAHELMEWWKGRLPGWREKPKS